jgi:Fur family iron response transcriptional regulator
MTGKLQGSRRIMTETAVTDGAEFTAKMATELRRAGLRPTRQRVSLGRLLFARGHRHISAEDLHAEAAAAGCRVSLATVYNALHQFTGAGLLREVAIDGSRTYFDTNVSDHHHFFVEGEGRLIDMAGGFAVDRLPEAPPGMEIVSVEVVVRVRRRR